MAPFREIDHTADLALHVTAETLAGLLIDAARGMFSLLGCEAPEGAPEVAREVTLDAPDAETLLVDWLGEILYLHEAHGECYTAFDIHALTPHHLEGTVRGRSGADSRRGIKAVTYSYLAVTKTAAGYEATVTFDV
jgi:SHS2 domain-containing protein